MRVVKSTIIILCLAANIAFLYFAWELSVATVALALLFFYISFAFQGAMHEVGHFVFGQMSGYRLVVLQIGRGNIVRTRAGKFSLSLRATRGGQCVMVPTEATPVKYVLYNVGGTLSNILLALGGCVLLLLHSPIATLICINLFFCGAFKAITNMIPSIKTGVPTDGYVLKLLKNRPAVQRDYAKYLSLYAKMFWGEKVPTEAYTYSRETASCREELLYYEEIQALLEDLKERPNT